MKRQARLSLFFEREAQILTRIFAGCKGFAGLYFGGRVLKEAPVGLKHFFRGAPHALKTADGVWEIDAWPIPHDFLDLIVLDHPLDLSADFDALMQEVLRVLRQEGTLIITGFNKMRLCSWPVQNDFGQEFACSIKRYSPIKISSLLNEAGFVTEIHYFDFCRFKILNRVLSKVLPFLGKGFVIVAERRTIDLKPLEELNWAFDSKKILEPAPMQGEYQKYDKEK